MTSTAITSDEHGLEGPELLSAGPATFTCSTAAEGRGWVGLARLDDGDWDSFKRNLRGLVSDDPDRIVAASAALHGSATLLGGAVIHPGLPAEVSVDLAPGPHVLFDYPDTATHDDPRHVLLRVVPAPAVADSTSAVIPPPAVVTAVTHAYDRPAFQVDGTLRAGEPVRFVNAMPAPGFSEFVLLPIGADVGEAELAEYFGRFVDFSGEWPENPPFDVSRGCGCLPLSSGESSDVVLPAGPGRYVLANWLKSETDGIRHVKRGQFVVVEIEPRVATPIVRAAEGKVFDRRAVEALLDRYVITLDTADADGRDDDWYRTIFTEQVRLEFPIGERTGVAGLSRFQREAFLTWQTTHHMSSNLVVDFSDDGDTAHARAQILATHVEYGADPMAVAPSQVLQVGGHYDFDALVVEGEWRIDRLRFEVRWITGSGTPRGSQPAL